MCVRQPASFTARRVSSTSSPAAKIKGRVNTSLTNMLVIESSVDIQFLGHEKLILSNIFSFSLCF